MPWRETWAMDERMRFVLAASEDEAVMSEACAEFGISRQTGYKWLARYRAEGAIGLQDRSRAPLRHGRAHAEELVAAVLAQRERHPSWARGSCARRLAIGRPGSRSWL
jgi:putative transposase